MGPLLSLTTIRELTGVENTVDEDELRRRLEAIERRQDEQEAAHMAQARRLGAVGELLARGFSEARLSADRSTAAS